MIVPRLANLNFDNSLETAGKGYFPLLCATLNKRATLTWSQRDPA